MSYIEANKAAWEEAFDNRFPNWGDDDHERLKDGRFALLNEAVRRELEAIDLNGKTVAQFCCNNGGELLSLVLGSGASHGVGFDIAENIIGQARETAVKTGIENCDFAAYNILDIPEGYHSRFDFIFFTIGAIIWFEDLRLLFEKTAKCLKTGGLLLINDFHPVMNMLALPGDDCFDQSRLDRFAYSYFTREPWVTNDGMGYMTDKYESKPFTSYSHTMSAIVNALSEHRIKTIKLNEYDSSDDDGLTGVYKNKGIPLSFVLIAEKS